MASAIEITPWEDAPAPEAKAETPAAVTKSPEPVRGKIEITPFGEDDKRAKQVEYTEIAQEIAHEMVKSYGFRYEDGEWKKWKPENIMTAFKEDPVWTTIDYLTLVVPVAKWGLAAKAINAAKDAGYVAKALKAGEFAGRAPTTFSGKVIGAFAGAEKAAAMESQLRRPAQSLTGRILNFEVRHGEDLQQAPDDIKLLEKYGGSEHDFKALGEIRRRELNMGFAANRRWRDNVIRDLQVEGATAEQQKAAIELLESGKELTGNPIYEKFGAKGQRALKSMDNFRGKIHDEAYKYGLLTEESYKEHLGKYYPHLYEEFMQDVNTVKNGGVASGRFKKRVLEGPLQDHEDLTAVRDLSAGVEGYAKAANAIARQKYVLTLAHSPMSKSVDDLTKMADAARAPFLKQAEEALAAGDARMNKTLLQDAEKAAEAVLKDDKGDLFVPVSDLMAKQGRSGQIRNVIVGEKSVASLEDVLKQVENYREAKAAGKLTPSKGLSEEAKTFLADYGDQAEETIRSQISQAGAQQVKAGEYAYKLGKDTPKESKLLGDLGKGPTERMIPRDLADHIKMLDKEKTNPIGEFYDYAMNVFKFGKTAANPPTHVRNFFSNQVFQSFITGHPISLAVPAKGIKALRARGSDYLEMVERGVLGTSFDTRAVNTLAELHGTEKASTLTRQTAEGLGAKRLGKFGEKSIQVIEKAENAASDLYTWEDEMYKAGAYLWKRDKLIKGGMDPEKARQTAQLEVARYMQNYSEMNGVVGAVRRHVPFISFPLESARIWKNVMTYKPHMAQFWNHMTEGMSEVFGAAAGADPEEIDAAKESIAPYARDKKTLVLPFRVNNRLQFLDMDYYIPFADVLSKESYEGKYKDKFLRGVFNPMEYLERNPAYSIGLAATTRIDPFTDRPLRSEWAPGNKYTEVIEYGLRTMLPPVVPPGWTGQAFIDLVRQNKDPYTGEPKQPSVGRFAMGNLLGVKSYQAEMKGTIRGDKEQSDVIQREISNEWKNHTDAMRRGDAEALTDSAMRIQTLRKQLDPDGDPKKYYEREARGYEPGDLSHIPVHRLERSLKKAKKAGVSKEELARYEEEIARKKRGKRKGPPKPPKASKPPKPGDKRKYDPLKSRFFDKD